MLSDESAAKRDGAFSARILQGSQLDALHEALDLPSPEMAAALGISESDLDAYERAESLAPAGFLASVAGLLRAHFDATRPVL